MKTAALFLLILFVIAVLLMTLALYIAAKKADKVIERDFEDKWGVGR